MKSINKVSSFFVSLRSAKTQGRTLLFFRPSTSIGEVDQLPPGYDTGKNRRFLNIISSLEIKLCDFWLSRHNVIKKTGRIFKNQIMESHRRRE
jgi:hypothetical protein